MGNHSDMPVGAGIEFFPVDVNKGTYGVKVVLPMGKRPEDYNGPVTASSIESTISSLLKVVSTDSDCVKVIDFDGTEHNVSKVSPELVLRSMMIDTIQQLAKEKYDDLKNEGVIPESLSFDAWFELEMAEAGGPSGAGRVH